MRVTLLLPVLLLLAGSIPASKPFDPTKEANRFAEAYTAWARWANLQSPYSPDYRESLAEKWYEEQVGEKFRRLEATLRDASQ